MEVLPFALSHAFPQRDVCDGARADGAGGGDECPLITRESKRIRLRSVEFGNRIPTESGELPIPSWGAKAIPFFIDFAVDLPGFV